MKIKASNGEIVDVPAKYQKLVQDNIDNPEYISTLVNQFRKQKGGANQSSSPSMKILTDYFGLTTPEPPPRIPIEHFAPPKGSRSKGYVYTPVVPKLPPAVTPVKNTEIVGTPDTSIITRPDTSIITRPDTSVVVNPDTNNAITKEVPVVEEKVPRTDPPVQTSKKRSPQDIINNMQLAYYDMTNPDSEIAAAGRINFQVYKNEYAKRISELNETAREEAGFLDSFANDYLPSYISKGLQKYGLTDQPELYEYSLPVFETFGQRKEKQRQDFITQTRIEDLGSDPNNRWRVRANASNENPLTVIPYGTRGERDQQDVNIKAKGTLMHFLDQNPITGYTHPQTKQIFDKQKDTEYVGVLDPSSDNPQEYNVRYITKGDLKKQGKPFGKNSFLVRQTNFDNIDFNKTVRDYNFAGHTYWSTKDNTTPLPISSGGNEQIYNYSSGQSVVFIFPYNNTTRYVHYSGSPSEIRSEGNRIKTEYNLKKGDLTLGLSDAGSYSSNIKSANGLINNDLLNSTDFGYHNLNSYTGAGMALKKQGGSWEPNKHPYKYSERMRINSLNPMAYGGTGENITVYPAVMNNGGISDPYFPNPQGQYTSKRLNNFINLVKSSAQKAMVKQLEKSMYQPDDYQDLNMPVDTDYDMDPTMSLNMEPNTGYAMGGPTPYQNGFTAGTGWLARSGGSNPYLPMAQAGTGLVNDPEDITEDITISEEDIFNEKQKKKTQKKMERNARRAMNLFNSRSFYDYVPNTGSAMNPYIFDTRRNRRAIDKFNKNSTNVQFDDYGNLVAGDINAEISKVRRSGNFDLKLTQPSGVAGVNEQKQPQISGLKNAGPDWSSSWSSNSGYNLSQDPTVEKMQKQKPPTMDPNQQRAPASTSTEPNSVTLKARKRSRNGLLGNPDMWNAGMDAITGFANRIDASRQEAQNRIKTSADYMFDPIAGSRGDYTPNYGYFRPDQMVPVQYYGAAGSRNYEYGGSANDGIYMSDQEIQELLANGGEIEYLD